MKCWIRLDTAQAGDGLFDQVAVDFLLRESDARCFRRVDEAFQGIVASGMYAGDPLDQIRVRDIHMWLAVTLSRVVIAESWLNVARITRSALRELGPRLSDFETALVNRLLERFSILSWSRVVTVREMWLLM